MGGRSFRLFGLPWLALFAKAVARRLEEKLAHSRLDKPAGIDAAIRSFSAVSKLATALPAP